MTIDIRVRKETGQFIYRSAFVGEFAEAALDRIIDDGVCNGEDGWWWLKSWLCSVMIKRAERKAGDHAKADLWYSRYQAIRGIK